VERNPSSPLEAVRVPDIGRRKESMSTSVRRQALEGRIRPGDRWVTRRTFSEEETLAFGDMIRDYNPVHYDARFSAARGFPERILHGLLTASMICELGGQSGWLAASMSFSFRKPVYFGDTIECWLTIREIDGRGYATAEAVYTNQHGECVLEATLAGFLPGETERDALRRMVGEGDPTNKLRESR
jgi:3-hydroxybutyryl-CoA dehydratase